MSQLFFYNYLWKWKNIAFLPYLLPWLAQLGLCIQISMPDLFNFMTRGYRSWMPLPSDNCHKYIILNNQYKRVKVTK